MINPTLEFLYKLHNRGIKLGLENIESFLNVCDNPHQKIKTIHLAGTNGKGSTASILAKILQQHGLKVGLYTSPHLVRFNERIRINGSPISDEKIVNFVNQHKKIIKDSSITFFETTTALAFSYFAKNNVDIAIIETGLGGRLDSTNVISPIQTIITEIDYDHTHILGESIELITSEKCGIFKKEIPALTANSNKEVIGIIEQHAKDKNCDLKKHAKNIVFSDGNPKSKIMLIGEAPGANEDHEGLPFVGRAGQLLDKMLSAIDLDRRKVYISNIINYRPPENRRPTEDEIKRYLPFISKHIEIIKPKILVLLGSTAMNALISSEKVISKMLSLIHI